MHTEHDNHKPVILVSIILFILFLSLGLFSVIDDSYQKNNTQPTNSYISKNNPLEIYDAIPLTGSLYETLQSFEENDLSVICVYIHRIGGEEVTNSYGYFPPDHTKQASYLPMGWAYHTTCSGNKDYLYVSDDIGLHVFGISKVDYKINELNNFIGARLPAIEFSGEDRFALAYTTYEGETFVKVLDKNAGVLESIEIEGVSSVGYGDYPQNPPVWSDDRSKFVVLAPDRSRFIIFDKDGGIQNEIDIEIINDFSSYSWGENDETILYSGDGFLTIVDVDSLGTP